jgi:hypothetical protein
MIGSKAWKKPTPLLDSERVAIGFDPEAPSFAPEATSEAEMGLTEDAEAASNPRLVQMGAIAKSK